MSILLTPSTVDLFDPLLTCRTLPAPADDDETTDAVTLAECCEERARLERAAILRAGALPAVLHALELLRAGHSYRAEDVLEVLVGEIEGGVA